MVETVPPTRPPEPLDRLRRGPLELLGRIVDSSNGTFLASVGEIDEEPRPTTDGDADPRSLGHSAGASPARADIGAEVCIDTDDGLDEWDDAAERERERDGDGDGEAEGDGPRAGGGVGGRDTGTGSLPPGLKGVYKPLAGERPLWDFPEGLYRREIAAYELSVALGWDCIPGTVERDDALGVGSLQRFVEADFSRHYFVLRDEGRSDDQLLRMGLFDVLANNTDRKGGHVLVDADDHIWGIDNGLCFSTEARLRTVIWDFAGEPIPDELMDAVTTLLDRGLPSALTVLLREQEIEMLLRRARMVRHARQMPHDPTGRAIPWPLV